MLDMKLMQFLKIQFLLGPDIVVHLTPKTYQVEYLLLQQLVVGLTMLYQIREYQKAQALRLKQE